MKKAVQFLGVGFLLVCAGLVGCTGYAERVQDARSALDQGAPREALRSVNKALDVKKAEEVPPLEDDAELLLLERSAILFQQGRYRLSSRDLRVADKAVEILDFSRKGIHEVGRYLFSDDSGPYKAPAYEKLLINSLNMANYLSLGDLSGARVEARRFAVMQRFVEEHEGHGKALSGFGSYLAGFVFEMSGNLSEARIFYKQSFETSMEVPGHPKSEEELASCQRTKEGAEPCGELLVVLAHGRVPGKIAKRIPVGLALTFASPFLSPGNVQLANRLAAQGLVTWVNYPTLERPRPPFGTPRILIDGKQQQSGEVLAVDRQAFATWQEAKGQVVAAALVRMLARAAVGAGAQTAVKGVGGILLSLGTQAALTARDTPDTRSWSMLPARLRLLRVRLPPGKHKVRIDFGGTVKESTVRISKGGFTVVSGADLR